MEPCWCFCYSLAYYRAWRFERSPTSPIKCTLIPYFWIFDINDCEFEFWQCFDENRSYHIEQLYREDAQKAIKLGDYWNFSFEQLKTMFEMFHIHMQAQLKKYGRRRPQHALKFWRISNLAASHFSLLVFNKVSKPTLSSQTSFTSA